jgi:hypothetical protein
MTTVDNYRVYAADCVRQAEDAGSADEKAVLLNVALAWIRLAHQKEAMTDKAARGPRDLDAASEAPAVATETEADEDAASATVVDLGTRREAVRPEAQPAPV